MINFPDAPTNGQQFQSGASTWQWDATKWIPITTLASLPLTVPNGGTGTVTLPVNALGFIPPFTTALLHGQGTSPVITGTANWTIQGGRFAGAEISMISAVTGATNLINMFKGEGTLVAPTKTNNNLTLGTIGFGGYDGTYWQTGSSSIQATSTQDWTGSARGSQLIFRTTPNDTTSASGAVTFTGFGGINTTSDITVVSTTSNHAVINLRKPSGTLGRVNIVNGWTAATTRWGLVLGDGSDESGGNNGSNFVVWRYNDSGTLVDAPFSISRATGQVGAAGELRVGGGGTGGIIRFGNAGYPVISTDASNFACQLGSGNGAFVWYNNPGSPIMSLQGSGGVLYVPNGMTVNSAGSTASGTVSLNPGTTINTGYLSWNKPGGTRFAYLGYSQTVLTLVLEGGGGVNFSISGGSMYPDPQGTYWCGLPSGSGPWWYGVAAQTFPVQSDARHKTDITTLPADCLDLVEAIAPKRYQYAKTPEGEEGRVFWGYIAQEVGEAFDAAGHDFSGAHRVHGEDGWHSLDYGQMNAVLWKAVQELTARVKSLEAQTQ